MTRADLIYDIERQTKLDKHVVEAVIQGFINSVQKNMLRGENIYMRGFGGFILKKRAEKTARIVTKNIQIKVPAHYVATFKVAKEFNTKIKDTVTRINKEIEKEEKTIVVAKKMAVKKVTSKTSTK